MFMPKLPSILIVAGEASGDSHGAHLVKHILNHSPDIQFFAMGGSKLSNAGAHLIVDAKELAVVGFLEVLSKLKKIRSAYNKLILAVKKLPPDIVILIDYPGFNLRLAKAIKKLNPTIKIIYYISPQLWAWRYQRIQTIKQYIDMMAVIFPFEVAIYEREKIPVKFVGNPLVDQVKTSLLPSSIRQFFGLDHQNPIIGLMPGSRQNEIKHILPTMLEAAFLLKQQSPEIEFILPLAPTINEKDLKPYLEKLPFTIKLTQEFIYDAISICEAVIVTSGTATLEVALLNKPMVIIYKSSRISIAIAKLLVKVKHIGLCNIVAQKQVVKELIQDEASPENIMAEVGRLLRDSSYREQVIIALKKVSEKLKQEDIAISLDKLVFEFISKLKRLNPNEQVRD